jgi:hypothetical protein
MLDAALDGAGVSVLLVAQPMSKTPLIIAAQIKREPETTTILLTSAF